MKTIWCRSLLSLLLVVGCSAPFTRVIADENAFPLPPDVQTFTVDKEVPGGNVVLNWTDGTAPFSVRRSESPNFLAPTNLTYVARSTLGGPVNDPILSDGKTYYYLVGDANAATQVNSITNAAGAGFFEGDHMLLDGVGFDSNCANDTVFFDDCTEAVLDTCSTTQIEAEIPAHVVSGSVTILSPNGISTRQTKLYAVGVRSNTARQAQTHINVSSSNNLYVEDQTPGFNRIWIVNYSSGVASECANVGNPIGLPRNGSKFYVGTETPVTNNVGSVRELDASCSPLVNWGATGVITDDPVWARAMAVDPSGNNNDYVFVLDHSGDRIRRRQNMTNLDTMWLTGLGLGGNTPGASDPAGFVFNNAGEFFFTAQPNKIRQFKTDRTLIQEFTSSDGVNRASQLAFDEAQTLWVANRDGNNVLRIRTNPLDKLVRPKISGISAPRGIALDRDPVTTNPWVYVADQTLIYRFRVYDTVHLDIKVFNETLKDPNTGSVTSQAVFEQRVRTDANAIADVLKICGIDVVVDRIVFIPDPNGDTNGGDGSVLTNLTATLTQDELDVLAASRSSNVFAIDVYYINHFLQTNGVPPPPGFTVDLIGRAYTNDSIPTIVNRGIMVSRFAAPSLGGILGQGAAKTTLGHEVGHSLLNNFNNGGPGNIEHKGVGCAPNDPNRFFLMHGTGCDTRFRLSPAECNDMLTNGDESNYVERF